MRHPHWVTTVAAVVLLCSVGCGVSSVAGARWGWGGHVLGFVVGFLGPVAALWVFAWGGEYIRRGGPRYPPCHSGTCTGRRAPSMHEELGDYERAWAGDAQVLRCKCGRDYVTRGPGGTRFMERLKDGTLKPYMVHRPYRGWYPDAEMSVEGGDEQAAE